MLVMLSLWNGCIFALARACLSFHTNRKDRNRSSAPHQSATLLANKPSTSLPDNSVDWKFNLMIYGGKENPKDTDRLGPCLVKLSCIFDIDNVLYNRSDIAEGVVFYTVLKNCQFKILVFLSKLENI